tara:strand:+ start:580 stop:723 length:144 start_codon:yes stop_codon:yes gene_type:complete
MVTAEAVALYRYTVEAADTAGLGVYPSNLAREWIEEACVAVPMKASE